MNPLLQFIKDNSNKHRGLDYKFLYVRFRNHEKLKDLTPEEYKLRLNTQLSDFIQKGLVKRFENPTGIKYMFVKSI